LGKRRDSQPRKRENSSAILARGFGFAGSSEDIAKFKYRCGAWCILDYLRC